MDSEARDARRRLIIAALTVIAVFAVMVGALMFLGNTTKRSDDDAPIDQSATTIEAVEDDGSREDQTPLAAAYEVPETTSPEYFARRFVEALLTYDTAEQTLEERRDALRGWITTDSDGLTTTVEELYENLDDWLPTPSMWSAMTASGLRQRVKVTQVQIPDEMRKAHRDAIKSGDPLAGNQILWVSVETTTTDDTGYAVHSSDVMAIGVRCPPTEGALCAGIGDYTATSRERGGN